jgi:hypothetical protein
VAIADSQEFSCVKNPNRIPSLEPSFPSLSTCIPGTSQLMTSHSTSPPGYRELEDEESSLSVVLDSLIPFIRGNDANVQLPVILVNWSLTMWRKRGG